MYKRHKKGWKRHSHWDWGGDWKNWQNWEKIARKAEQANWRRPKYNIPVNIIENETEFIAHVYAVSFPKEGIKISVVDDTLYISGTRTPEGNPSPNFMLQEYPIKSFERAFELSHTVDQSKIKAKHENGVLTIIAPKTVEAQEPEHDIEID